MQSLTDATRCNHRTPPIKDCHKCLCRELVDALEQLASGGIGASTSPDFWCVYCGSDNSHFNTAPDDTAENHEEDCPIVLARTLIDKAKLIDPDCEEK